MAKKISLLDFGRLVKPRNISETFLLCNAETVDPYNWYSHHLHIANNLAYKQDLIIGIYGVKLEKLFENLEIDSYVGTISSFLVFHERRYKFVTSVAQAQQVLNSKKNWSIRAIGLNFYKNYNQQTKTIGDKWEYNIPTISWFYKPRSIIPIETVELHNSVEIGDLIAFKKTQAIVINIKNKSPKRWWSRTNWTTKKITVLAGSKGHRYKLNTHRPYEVRKAKTNQ